MTTPIAIIGLGKIARDQHVPTLAASKDFVLAAIVSRHGTVEGVPTFSSVAEMAAARPDIRALSVCTPPKGRLALAREALAAGLDLMIEKPPAATLSEAEHIVGLARAHEKTLFVTWHSREAAAVGPARDWLAQRTIQRVTVNWKEDVRIWHPGQEWIWSPGIGVFDPGINALSVLTTILPRPLEVVQARLRFPANRAAPIAADLRFADEASLEVNVSFDFDQRGPQTWEILVETSDGTLRLVDGASRMMVDDEPVTLDTTPEYTRLYRRFAELLAHRQSETDLSPFRLVADCFLLGEREIVQPFEW